MYEVCVKFSLWESAEDKKNVIKSGFYWNVYTATTNSHVNHIKGIQIINHII